MFKKKLLIPLLLFTTISFSWAGYEEGVDALKERNFELAFNEFSAAVAGGNGEALIDLALFYERGVGVDLDLKKAFELFKKAGLLNVKNSYSFLGDMYYKGVGTEQDFVEALRWYLRAADNEHAASTFFVARMLEYGLGTEADKGQAIVWYYKALDNNHLSSQLSRASEDGLSRLGIEYRHVHVGVEHQH
jgi:TPR repeat protein